MREKDLEFYCLLGKPFLLEGIGHLHVLKINEILDIGFEKYNQILSLLCISKEEICKVLKLNDIDEVNSFEFLLYNCLASGSDFRDNMFDALRILFKENISISEEGVFFIGDIEENRVLHKLNYNYFIDILKYQNCINTNKEEIKVKSKNDKVKEYLEKLKKEKQKHDKKFNNETQLTDIISSVCAKHPSINLLNVGNMTIYQIINQYKRLNYIDDYFMSIDSLMNGAKKEDVDLKHWSTNMNEQNQDV